MTTTVDWFIPTTSLHVLPPHTPPSESWVRSAQHVTGDNTKPRRLEYLVHQHTGIRRLSSTDLHNIQLQCVDELAVVAKVKPYISQES